MYLPDGKYYLFFVQIAYRPIPPNVNSQQVLCWVRLGDMKQAKEDKDAIIKTVTNEENWKLNKFTTLLMWAHQYNSLKQVALDQLQNDKN